MCQSICQKCIKEKKRVDSKPRPGELLLGDKVLVWGQVTGFDWVRVRVSIPKGPHGAWRTRTDLIHALKDSGPVLVCGY